MRVTIGIAFFNAAKTLADAIRSVFAQTYTDWELLLIDDGSSDGSLAIAQAIRDPRVRVLSDGRNLGLAHRLNEIAHRARGDYLVRLDADDLMHSQRLVRQVDFLDAHPECAVIDCGVFSLGADNTPQGKRDCRALVIRPEVMLERGILNHPAVCGRTSWFLRHPYDPAFVRAEDHELWCRTCHDTRFARIPEPLLFYRELGVPTLRKYLETWKTDRRIVRHYGRNIAGAGTSAWLYGKIWAKSCLWVLAVSCRCEHWIIRRRNVPITPEEQAAAVAEVARVLAYRLPGLDDV